MSRQKARATALAPKSAEGYSVVRLAAAAHQLRVVIGKRGGARAQRLDSTLVGRWVATVRQVLEGLARAVAGDELTKCIQHAPRLWAVAEQVGCAACGAAGRVRRLHQHPHVVHLPAAQWSRGWQQYFHGLLVDPVLCGGGASEQRSFQSNTEHMLECGDTEPCRAVTASASAAASQHMQQYSMFAYIRNDVVKVETAKGVEQHLDLRAAQHALGAWRTAHDQQGKQVAPAGCVPACMVQHFRCST